MEELNNLVENSQAEFFKDSSMKNNLVYLYCKEAETIVTTKTGNKLLKSFGMYLKVLINTSNKRRLLSETKEDFVSAEKYVATRVAVSKLLTVYKKILKEITNIKSVNGK